ncbi:MAG: YkgJ family cysteine cluster protein [Candidatus Poribacteria bacterium]
MIAHTDLVLFQHNVDTFWQHTLSSFRDKGGVVACDAGCHHCCKVYATCSESEAELMAQYICQDDDRKDRLTAAIDRYLADLATRRRVTKYDSLPDENAQVSAHFVFGLRCPFLDADGRCEVYIVRPYGCRTHWAADTEDACATATLVQKIQPTDESTDAFVDQIHATGRADQYLDYDDIGRTLSQEETVGLIADQVRLALSRRDATEDEPTA